MVAQPIIMGHRGVPSLAPENTLGGFKKAASLGVTWVELDVTLLADDTVVVHHDAALGRCNQGNTLLSELNLTDLSDIDNSILFSDWPFECIPTLADVLDVLVPLNIGVNIEIKQHSNTERSRLVSNVLAVVKGRVPLDKLMLSSFDTDILALCQHMEPAMRRAWIVENIPSDWLATARHLNLTSLNCYWEGITQALVESVKSNGYDLLVWTVNDPLNIAQYWSWGLTGVITDYPQRFIDIHEFK